MTNPQTGNIEPVKGAPDVKLLKLIDTDYSNRRKYVLENYVGVKK
jgi:hypothetical protein